MKKLFILAFICFIISGCNCGDEQEIISLGAVTEIRINSDWLLGTSLIVMTDNGVFRIKGTHSPSVGTEVFLMKSTGGFCQNRLRWKNALHYPRILG